MGSPVRMRVKLVPAATTTAKHFLGPRLREGAFIGMSAVCLYLLLSLASYTPDDPGWSATGSTDYVSNAGGPAGAWLADVFFSLIGYLAYLFPLMLAWRALGGAAPTEYGAKKAATFQK